MISKLAGPKDFWIGLIYIGFGSLALYLGWDYKFGTAGRMGPGYFPLVLAAILVGLGFLSLLRSVLVKGEQVSQINWLPMILILLANASFGFLLPRAGAFIALVVMCFVAAIASNEFKPEWKATLGLFGIATLCILVFVNGLGVPMPVLGTWTEPLIGPVLYPITGAIKGVWNGFFGGLPLWAFAILTAAVGLGLYLLLKEKKA